MTCKPTGVPEDPVREEASPPQNSTDSSSRLAAPYLSEPFRCVCLSCEVTALRADREAALSFAADHEAGNVVLTPWSNHTVATDGGRVVARRECVDHELEEFRREDITADVTLVIYQCRSCGDRESEFVEDGGR